MTIRRLAAVVIACCPVLLPAQQPSPAKPSLISPVYVDPVCPVSSIGYAPNATKELHVMYYPEAKEAKIKAPQALTLYIGFNLPQILNNSAKIAFTQKDDHWEANAPLDRVHNYHAIFYVKDDKSGTIDDNSAKLWDVMFCTESGERSPSSIRLRAESYTGESWPFGIHRATDYNKAVSIIESFLASGAPRHNLLLETLWNYKAARDGGDAKAWSGVAAEIEAYINSHKDTPQWLRAIGNYIARTQEKFPTDFVDRMAASIDSLQEENKDPLVAQVMYTRAVHQRDPKRRLAALDEFIAKYPDAIEVAFAQESRFYALIEMKDISGVEQAFSATFSARQAHKDALIDSLNDHNMYLSLARLYIENNVQLDQAVKLADQARDTLKPDPRSGMEELPQFFEQSVEASIAETKARAYLAMKKPDLAVAEAEKAVAVSKSAQTCYMLAKALVANGEKRKAVDAYFDALLMPSNSDLKFSQELQAYYIKQGFGNESQFQAELEKRKTERFRAAKYVLTLVDKEAPALEFTTLKGEKFDAAALKGKTVVVNFWSPG